MGLANYSELKSSVINWSHRDDLDLLIDDFIELTETEMFANSVEALEIQQLETQSTASVSSSTTALPTSYQQMKSIRLQTSDGKGGLLYKTPEALNRKTGTGRPKYYTIHNQIEFDVTPDQTYTVEYNYVKKPTGLSTSNTTNEVIDNYPNIYLYGCLWQAFTYADDEAQAQKYYQRFIAAIRGANQASENGMFSSTPTIRPDGATP